MIEVGDHVKWTADDNMYYTGKVIEIHEDTYEDKADVVEDIPTYTNNECQTFAIQKVPVAKLEKL